MNTSHIAATGNAPTERTTDMAEEIYYLVYAQDRHAPNKGQLDAAVIDGDLETISKRAHDYARKLARKYRASWWRNHQHLSGAMTVAESDAYRVVIVQQFYPTNMWAVSSAVARAKIAAGERVRHG